MEIGDKVKVVRIKKDVLDIIKANNAPSPIGMVGTIVEMYYNPMMHRNEVVIEVGGNRDKWLWEPWNLDVICGH